MNLDPTILSILFFGVITSYTDIKHGKIKNIFIIFLFVSGIIINIFYTGTLTNPSIKIDSLFVQTVMNMTISFLVGFFLWASSLWSSGDAKLFFGYSALLPIFTYKFGYIPFFPSFTILINTFIPMASFLLVIALIRMDYKWLYNIIKKNFRIMWMVKLILFIFGFSYIIQAILSFLNIQTNFLLEIILLFVTMGILEKISNNLMLITSILGTTLKIILTFSSLLTLSFLIGFIGTMAFIIALMFLLNPIIEFSFTQRVKINDLKLGMVLGERLIKTRKGYIKKQSSLLTIFDIFKSMKENIAEKSITKLTEEEIKELKQLYEQKKLDFDYIKVTKTIPFAPFMFLGVLLTYLLQGSMLSYLHFLKI